MAFKMKGFSPFNKGTAYSPFTQTFGERFSRVVEEIKDTFNPSKKSLSQNPTKGSFVSSSPKKQTDSDSTKVKSNYSRLEEKLDTRDNFRRGRPGRKDWDQWLKEGKITQDEYNAASKEWSESKKSRESQTE